MNQQIFSLAVAFLQQNFIAILIGGVLAFAVLLWKVASWKAGLDKDQGNLTGGLGKLEKTVTDFMEEIRKDVKRIFERLPSPTIASQSPIRLTDLGNKIAEEIKVNEWVSEYAEKLSDRVEAKNAYDIQEFCFQYAQNELLEDLGKTVTDSAELKSVPFPTIEDIKLSAYDHGLELKQVLEVVGVVLRDEMLKRIGIEIPPDQESD